ncbi:MAG: hypothetical protein AAFV29_09855, partial [Myxococcota bacterium]
YGLTGSETGPIAEDLNVTFGPVAIAESGTAYYTTADGWLHAVAVTDGMLATGFPVRVGLNPSPPAIGDVDDDGTVDIFVANAQMVWRVREAGGTHPDGPYAPGWPVELGVPGESSDWGLDAGRGPSVVIADIDADEVVEIVVGLAHAPLVTLDINGTRSTPSSFRGLTGAFSLGFVEDFDAPLIFTLVGRRASASMPAETEATAFAWPNERLADREQLPEGFSVAWRDAMPLEPVLIDVDGDDQPEAIWPEGPDCLHALDRAGQTPLGWPKLTADEVVGAATSGDLDGDGRREIVVATRRGRLFAWRTDAMVFDAAPWDGYRHDVRASGDLRNPTGPVLLNDKDGCGCAAVARPKNKGERGPRPNSPAEPWPSVALLGLASIVRWISRVRRPRRTR